MTKNSGKSPTSAESPIASAKLAQPADPGSDTLLVKRPGAVEENYEGDTNEEDAKAGEAATKTGDIQVKPR